MAKICLCLTGKTIARNLEILEKYRKYTDIAELRVDYLEPNERLFIRRFPEKAGIPIILTIRREIDGGQFEAGEGGRITLFSKALAFADANPRRNFAYVDLEDYLQVPSLEEAARTFGTKIIRSYHNLEGVDDDLVKIIRSLSKVGDELVKVAVMPKSMDDVLRIFKASWDTMDIEKVVIGMGHFGIATRILAEQMGSYLTYTSVKGEADYPFTQLGQLDPKELVERYRFRNITIKTRIFGIAGYPLKVTLSPKFFNAVFDFENLDAVYIPFPADNLEPFMQLADSLGLAGASITVPHKETVLNFLAEKSPEVNLIGACNTIVYGQNGWIGYNVDAQGFSDSLLEFIDRKNLKGKKITIIGAGGAARAIVSEIDRLGGKALILNRTALRARNLALPYRYQWGGLDSQGIKLMKKYSDIIIQTTSAGMEGYTENIDPLELYDFTGREVVMDIVYQPDRTVCLRRAEEVGCRVINGYDMLIRQASLQYSCFLDGEFPTHLLSRMSFPDL